MTTILDSVICIFITSLWS